MRLTYIPIILAIVSIILVGCLIQPTDPKQIDEYNNQIVSLIQPFITPITGLLTILALWLKANFDKKDIKKTAELAAQIVAREAKETAEKVAVKTEQVAEKLAQKTDEVKEVVINKIQESHAESAVAIEKANNTNEKILSLQQQQARKPHRATDLTASPAATGAAATVSIPTQDMKDIKEIKVDVKTIKSDTQEIKDDIKDIKQ